MPYPSFTSNAGKFGSTPNSVAGLPPGKFGSTPNSVAGLPPGKFGSTPNSVAGLPPGKFGSTPNSAAGLPPGQFGSTPNSVAGLPPGKFGSTPNSVAGLPPGKFGSTPNSAAGLPPGQFGSTPNSVAGLPPGKFGSTRSRVVKPQGYRCSQHDYCEPCFYMITITTKDRAPILATCDKGCSHYTDAGQIALAQWRSLPEMYPQVETSTLMLMPDHLHGIIRVRERMEQPLGVPIRAFKSLVTSALRKQCANPGLQAWNPGYHDLIVLRRGALDAYSAYIRDNPRRFCVKRANPDLFVRVNNLTHARLPPAQTWSGYGNLFFLDRPLFINVRLSRSATAQEIDTVASHIRREVAQGAVVISPFISPGEKAIAEMVMQQDYGDLILMKPDAFRPYYKPHGHYFDLCAQGRLLILSAFPESKETTLTREKCLLMNEWCAAIANA